MSTFTKLQKERLWKIEGVSAIGGTNRRLVYVINDTPEIRAEVEKAVGSKRYKIEQIEKVQRESHDNKN